MKKNVLYNLALLPIVMLMATFCMAQTMLADQNPNYMVSQAKYTKMADSVNQWHSTTPQETYKAIDYLVDKREARDQRRAFRRELRMERARNGYYYNDYGYNYPGYYGYGNNYNNYRPYSGYRSRWNQYYWNALPLAATIGLWSWCR